MYFENFLETDALHQLHYKEYIAFVNLDAVDILNQVSMAQFFHRFDFQIEAPDIFETFVSNSLNGNHRFIAQPGGSIDRGVGALSDDTGDLILAV